MEQEIDFVVSCYEDDDQEYAKYIDHYNDHFYEGQEKLKDSFATQANSLIQSATNTMNESLASNTSFTSVQKNSPMQEQTNTKTSFNNISHAECDSISNPIQTTDQRCSIDLKYLQKEYNYENIQNLFQDNSTAFLHGEIAIQKQTSTSSICDSDFMSQDILKNHKQVCSITQTSNFLHVELSQIQQSTPTQINNIFSQWEQDKSAEQAWNIEFLQNDTQNSETFLSSQCQEICDLISNYIHITSQQQQYFQQNYVSQDYYQQNIQSQERFDLIKKRAFKILRKLQQNSETSIYSYKIVRKTPFEYNTLSRGLSNSFFDRLGLDKQETAQYIMRNNCLPFNCFVNTKEKLRENIEEIVTYLSYYKSSNINYQKTFQCEGMQFDTLIQKQVFPLNEQIGDQILDINDYLIVEIIQFDDLQIKTFSQQMKQRKSKFGFCYSSTEFQYKIMSSNIVERYYQNYSEQQRQENQIIRLLNKKNHRFH